MRLHLLQQPMPPMLPVVRPEQWLQLVSAVMVAIAAEQEQFVLAATMVATTKALPSPAAAPPSWATEQAALRQHQPPFTLRSS